MNALTNQLKRPDQPGKGKTSSTGCQCRSPIKQLFLQQIQSALDGSASTDPNNNISSYLWTKISGPSSFTIANANSVQTQVTNLVEGVYQFELKVTDAGGLFDKDMMQVTVLMSLSHHHAQHARSCS